MGISAAGAEAQCLAYLAAEEEGGAGEEAEEVEEGEASAEAGEEEEDLEVRGNGDSL